MTKNIIKAQESDAKIISELAEKIWFPIYSPILPEEQIIFMLRDRYSVNALCRAMGEGEDFFFLKDENHHDVVGFISLRIRKTGMLRIEKLYVLTDQHGKGYGKLLLNFAKTEAKKCQCSYLELNVNRRNRAVGFYEKEGFQIVQKVDIPYGNYIVEDYVMQQSIAKPE